MDCVRINRIKIYRYSIPLALPLQIKNIKLTERQGFLLALSDADHHTGWGEIAPLPGLHRETYTSALKELKALGHFLLNIHNRYVWQQVENILIKKKVLPSVMFGIESALLNLKAVQNEVLLPTLLQGTYRKQVAVNALLTRNEPDPVSAVKNLLRQGYKTIKIKVGGKDSKRELDLLRVIAHLVIGRAQLRLDANRSWNLQQARMFMKELQDLPIEYIEEPLKDPGQGDKLYSAIPCTLAIDESINVFHKKWARFPAWIKVLVIKPAVVGGINATLQLIQKCESQEIDCIISDTFHSGVGLSVSTALAAGIIGHRRAMGLDTFKWLSHDLLKKKLRVRRGQIDVNLTARNGNDIKISHLHELITIK